MIYIERNVTLGILNGAYFALSLNYEGSYEAFIASRVGPGNLGQFCTNFLWYHEFQILQRTHEMVLIIIKTLNLCTCKNNDRVECQDHLPRSTRIPRCISWNLLSQIA